MEAVEFAANQLGPGTEGAELETTMALMARTLPVELVRRAYQYPRIASQCVTLEVQESIPGSNPPPPQRKSFTQGARAR
jgi:hypothetical protein